MAERPDKERRKGLLNQVRDEERAAARAALPLSDELLEEFFDALDSALTRQVCDHTRKLTRSWLEERGLPLDKVLSWMDEHGGYCDCEVLFNVEEHWRVVTGRI
jgi:hypothetical protein